MAWYIDSKNVKKNTNEKANAKYEKIWKPGEKPDCAGIYRCQACGYEDLINRQCNKLPPCSNCEKKAHKNNTWKLLVRAVDAE
ncbi:hypothetical protein J5K60_002576 [Escherichia coli]|uniref:hypothetical protein n=1 Tax=Escherichia TaxID=561 RepID=UPI000B7E4CF9|nr:MULTISPECIES: hypothetical protein [Escherichia]EBF1418327.1 hypothetical protein [Salmonella enterica]ECT6020410.1 hypothetical protein [Salmonella enterica subsp. enterica serovar Infantis]ECV9594824.1 hypothetical protein [Salmonella enterica subsp. enterica serovar Typhimurium]EGX7085341.1 hypothetical protein [Salmonella enterica subsp. enterica serovar 4:i:-]EKB2433100.1 hypothetical protein [Salmonella enterica subsp. enterica serovar Enteritidis]